MAKVEIENVKSIARLSFEIPVGGVRILTGINGCGKTTLLTCLERLANPRKNSNVVNALGFGQVIYLTSSGERFYVQNEELNTRNISAVPQFFKESMNNEDS